LALNRGKRKTGRDKHKTETLTMGTALYISIKDAPKDLDTFMDGKSLARAWEAFNPIAAKLGLPNFGKLCSTAWKSPEKGLQTFTAYLAYLQQHPESIPDSAGVIDDLEDVIRLIGEAKKLGTKWRLLLDY